MPLLADPAEFTGDWWLPGNVTQTATGRLIFDPEEGLTLDVISELPFILRGPSASIVHGLTVDGQKITLRDVFQRLTHWHSPGGNHTIASVSAAFIGIHAKTEADLRFEAIEARLLNLIEWGCMSGIDVPAGLEKGGTVTLKTPPTLTLARSAGTIVTVRYDFVDERVLSKPRSAPPYELTVRQQAWLVLSRSKGRWHYDKFDELLNVVRWFLGFAAAAQDELLELRGTTTVTTSTFGPQGRTYRYSGPVSILLSRHTLIAPEHRLATEMLFCCADLRKGEIARPLTRWLSLWRRLSMDPVFGPYWAALATRSFYGDHRFAVFAQSAEAYVGRRRANLDFRRKIEHLIASAPASIKTRLPAGLAKEILFARNHVTHRDVKSQKRAAKGPRLWALTELTKFLLDLAILKELGFTQTEIVRLVDFERNRRVAGLFQRALEVLDETTPLC